MSEFPDRPFLTKRFESPGGGIDFLGLRQVNLDMLQRELIPGINNATRDFGMFCLGAWIPWKFRQLCEEDPKGFARSRFNSFREAMEVAMAYAVRDGSPANVQFGKPRRRIGVRQRFSPPSSMTFKAVKRTGATSIYAAPLYGPALWYTGFLIGYARARDGSSTEIPLATEDAWTKEILRAVEAALSKSNVAARLIQPQISHAEAKALDELALHGLHPSFYRRVTPSVKIAFIQKFLLGDKKDPFAERRRLTAALLCHTVRQGSFRGAEELRACWYTALRPSGEPLKLLSTALQEHRLRWALFQARQIQRTLIEGFLRSFELALLGGCRSVTEVLSHWAERSPAEPRPILDGTFEALVRAEAAPVSRARDFLTASRAWHAKVAWGHSLYEDCKPPNDDEELVCRLRMLARWWLRVALWMKEGVLPRFLEAGYPDRIPMRWFWEWLEARLATPIRALLEQLYSDLVFAQHIKVALTRFDGKIQRLHFTLGDDGIVPTAEARAKLGFMAKPMEDRLEAFLGLLCDVDVLSQDEEGLYSQGPHGSLIEGSDAGKAVTRKSGVAGR